MAELAVEHLTRHQTSAVYVANRTFENAVALAERFRGNAIGFEEIPRQLGEVDIIISSTGAPDISHKPRTGKKGRTRKTQPPYIFH